MLRAQVKVWERAAPSGFTVKVARWSKRPALQLQVFFVQNVRQIHWVCSVLQVPFAPEVLPTRSHAEPRLDIIARRVQRTLGATRYARPASTVSGMNSYLRPVLVRLETTVQVKKLQSIFLYPLK